MAKQSSGTGRGGKSFQDRQLASDVRVLGLTEIQYILQNFGFTTAQKARKEKEIKKENRELYDGVVLNLSKSILPRLNEHSGEGGEPIKFSQVEVTFK